MLCIYLLLLVPLNMCQLFDCVLLFTSIMNGLFPVNTIYMYRSVVVARATHVDTVYYKGRSLMPPSISCVHSIDTYSIVA